MQRKIYNHCTVFTVWLLLNHFDAMRQKKIQHLYFPLGSASAHYHVLSSESNNLFQRAILMSGSTLNPWARYAPGEHMLHMFMIG